MTVYVKTPNNGTLNLRVAPKGAIIAQIPNGTKLEAQSEGEWSKVGYNGKIGYVKTQFLSTSNDNLITKENLKEIYDSLQQALKAIEKILK